MVAIALLGFWLFILLGNYVLKGKFFFEGNALVQEINFTYAGQKDQQQFLNTISGIKKIDLEGSQPEPLVLTGKFSSADPTLNQQISKLDRLSIQLPYAQSRFILTPATSVTPAKLAPASELKILDLRLLQNSQVNQLAYQTQRHQLSFCLQTATALQSNCRFSADEQPTQTNPTSVSTLQLLLGQPLTVDLESIGLEQLGIKASRDDSQPLSFQFIPNKTELLLTLLSPTHLYIDLPSIPSKPNASSDRPTEWLRGDLDVEKVNFIRFENTGNTNDEITASTILNGEVRMGRETMKLQPNQFLVVASKPGITKLRYIQIQSKSPQGLKTLFFGESDSLAVGLYPKFPVQRIEPSWLSKNLSQEAINAILSFVAALTGFFLPRLFPDSSKPNS